MKYAEAISGFGRIAMVFRIREGRDAVIELPFIVFKNDKRSYPIRGLSEDILVVSYRSGPKGCMDTTVMLHWLSERKLIPPLHNGRMRICYVGSCSGHNETPQFSSALERINTKIVYFEPNITECV